MARVTILFRDGSERVLEGQNVAVDARLTESGAVAEYVISGDGYIVRVPASSVNSVEEWAEWAE